MIAGCIGRIQCEVGQNVLSRPIAGSDLHKLDQIRLAWNGVVRRSAN